MLNDIMTKQDQARRISKELECRLALEEWLKSIGVKDTSGKIKMGRSGRYDYADVKVGTRRDGTPILRKKFVPCIHSVRVNDGEWIELEKHISLEEWDARFYCWK
tara:strand:+ start:2404 stop:2718 length:315 start_codon:yes stop_codon:yes gene_type:complete